MKIGVLNVQRCKSCVSLDEPVSFSNADHLIEKGILNETVFEGATKFNAHYASRKNYLKLFENDVRESTTKVAKGIDPNAEKNAHIAQYLFAKEERAKEIASFMTKHGGRKTKNRKTKNKKTRARKTRKHRK